MLLSKARLHASPDYSSNDLSTLDTYFTNRRIQAARVAGNKVVQETESFVTIPITTVSLDSNFDSFIEVWASGKDNIPILAGSLIFDTGNTTLIMPNFDDFRGLEYTVVIDTPGLTEPFGCPAVVVQGPIYLSSTSGMIEIPDVVFYACTGLGPGNRLPTANFGAGCIKPWSASGWNLAVPGQSGVFMKSPFAYSRYNGLVITFGAAQSVLAADGNLLISSTSSLILSQCGFPSALPVPTMMPLFMNIEWMSVFAGPLSIDGTLTQWPGQPAVAFIDTGGGPAFLTDPNGLVYRTTWPDQEANPSWTSGSQSCQTISAPVTITVGSFVSLADWPTYVYTVDTTNAPSTVQKETLVICEINQYMEGQYGMNIGGISALFLNIYIDYDKFLIGFSPNPASNEKAEAIATT